MKNEKKTAILGKILLSANLLFLKSGQGDSRMMLLQNRKTKAHHSLLQLQFLALVSINKLSNIYK